MLRLIWYVAYIVTIAGLLSRYPFIRGKSLQLIATQSEDQEKCI